MELDIQRFADGKIVIDAILNRKNFENGLDKMKGATQRAGSTIKNIVVGLGITKLIGTAMNQITGSVDSAITRLDTLNQFPKVMSNLGIGAEDAQKSIEKMSDKLSGLPTTLDEGARAVQRFTSKNSDVAKSTDLFLALNNAILAGGASSEIQSSALEQLSQAYAKGKPDMMEWRTAMTAMPAQLKQVATAMGYVDADALGEALREGSVSMDEFMDTITRLNTEGVEGFQSFEQQARNSTGGIQTSITVAKTQVVKGVTDIIEAINTKLGEVGLGGIGDVISNIGKKAKEGLDDIAKLITGELSIGDYINAGIQSINGYITGFAQKIPDAMSTATNLINEVIKSITGNIPQLVESAKLFITNFVQGFTTNLPLLIEGAKTLIMGLIEGFVSALPTIIQSAIDLVFALVDAILENIDFIILAGVDLLMALAEGLAEGLPRLIEKIPEIITKLVEALIKNLPKIVDAGLQIIIMLTQGILEGLVNLLLQLPEMLWNIGKAIIEGIGKGLSDSKKWLKQRIGEIKDNILNTLKNLPNNMMNIGKNLVKGIWNGIKNAKQWVLDKISGFAKSIVKGIKGIFGIKSPSKVMRDEVGKFLAEGIGVGFEDEIDSVYKSMQHAIDLEQAKLQANVETGKVFNTLQNSTPIEIDVNGDVELDGTKVGRLITPVVSKTIKTGGGV